MAGIYSAGHHITGELYSQKAPNNLHKSYIYTGKEQLGIQMKTSAIHKSIHKTMKYLGISTCQIHTIFLFWKLHNTAKTNQRIL